MSSKELKALIEKTYEINEFICKESDKNSSFLILTHLDADGLTAGGILTSTLKRLNSSFHLRVVKDLDVALLDEIKKLKHDVIIFSEIGSGYLEYIHKIFDPDKTIIVDHHPIIGEAANYPYHINPVMYGFDGTTEISGSGIMYYVVKEIGRNSTDLSTLAVVGALGDMQDKNDKRRLEGLNRSILEEGINSGFLKEETDLIFFGRETRPLHKAIASTTLPFLPGLSGREDRCLSLLSSIGIPPKKEGEWNTVSTLSNEEKQQLISKIIEFLSAEGHDGEIAKKLIGSVYTLIKENKGTILRDGREYAVALNSCGRMGQYGLGISICLGDNKSIGDVEKVLTKYRLNIAKYMNLILEDENLITHQNHLTIIRGENSIPDNMSGAISSMLNISQNFDQNKALLVVTKADETMIKISARSNAKLYSEKSIDLGKILTIISRKYGGIGGGHKVAAGAKIPNEKLLDFIDDVNKEFDRIVREK